MNYSNAEKGAINHYLVKLIKVDGQTDFPEITALYDICESMGISVNISDASLDMPEAEAKSIIKSMNVEKRLEALQLLKKVAHADGQFASSEKDFIWKIFT